MNFVVIVLAPRDWSHSASNKDGGKPVVEQSPSRPKLLAAGSLPNKVDAHQKTVSSVCTRKCVNVLADLQRVCMRTYMYVCVSVPVISISVSECLFVRLCKYM